jgi:RimJ/RimL family protein N-acetyltransferase
MSGAYLADTPVIETERLVLRGPLPSDWPVWRDFAQSPRAAFIGGPMDLGRAWRAFCHVVGMWAVRGFGSFVITAKGDPAPLGMAGPWHPADWPEREIGWAVWSPAAEGKGLAFEAARAARDHAYRVLGWPTAVSYIAPGNTRSIRLAERLGARLDPTAAAPQPEDGTLVYRHPGPEART